MSFVTERLGSASRLNVGEYGESILIDLGEDVSSYTMTVVLKDPSGNETIKSAAVGLIEKTDSLLGLLSANEYIEYTIDSGLINKAGTWFVRAVATEVTKIRKTNWLPFRVKA